MFFCHVKRTLVILLISIILQAELTQFYTHLYVLHIFGHSQICTNENFDYNSISAKGKYFFVSLIFTEDNS